MSGLILGFPFVVTLAWFFELTPEGLKRTVDVDDYESITRDTGRRIDRSVIGLLSLAVVFLLVRSVFVGNPDPVTVEVDGGTPVAVPEPTVEAPATPALPEPDDQPSVAVLPLVNMSSDVENERHSASDMYAYLTAMVKMVVRYMMSSTTI